MDVQEQSRLQYELPQQALDSPDAAAPRSSATSELPREAAGGGALELAGAMAAFRAGWQMAELSELVAAPATGADLPVDKEASGQGGLLAMMKAGPGPLERVWLCLQLIDEALEEVTRVTGAGAVKWLICEAAANPHGQPVEVRLCSLKEHVQAATWRDQDGAPLPLTDDLLEQLGRALPRIHSSILQCLYAADLRFGTAYALGLKLRMLTGALERATSRVSRVDVSDAVPQAEVPDAAPQADVPDAPTWAHVECQLAELQDMVSALKGLQQEHYAHPVCQSIGTWRACLTALPARDLRRPVSWALRRDAALVRRFHEQAHLWHQILAGEARGEQLLSLESIVGIGCEALRRLRRSTVRLLLALAPVLTALLVLGGGVVLLAVQHANGSAVSTTAFATFVTIIASAWRAAGPARDRLMKTVDAHQQQLFGADIDHAVGQAITLVPAPPTSPILRGMRMRSRLNRLAA